MSKTGKTWDRVGGIWLHERGPDGAGNTQQYLLGSIKVGGRDIKFSGHPNPAKTDPKHPDYLLFVKPAPKGGPAK